MPFSRLNSVDLVVPMEKVTVSQKILHEMMYGAIARAVTILPRDVKEAVKQSLDKETNELGRLHLKTILDNAELCEQGKGLLCGDTGTPLFYVKLGDNVRIENGLSSLYEMVRKATAEATRDGLLRENIVHPLTQFCLPGNVGPFIPNLEMRFDPDIDYLEVIAVPKGGGAENFGTYYGELRSEDKREGLMKFLLDAIKKSTYAGLTCAPGIIGIGIGGTADVCMKIAKVAAVLRPVGSRNSDPEVADLETELLECIKFLNRGPMGTGGITGMLDVHIEIAAVQSGGMKVAFNSQCSMCRRATSRYGKEGSIEYGDVTSWEYR